MMETPAHGQFQPCCFNDNIFLRTENCENGGGPLGEVLAAGLWAARSSTDVEISTCPTIESQIGKRNRNFRKRKDGKIHATCGNGKRSKFATCGSNPESKSSERSDLTQKTARKRKDSSPETSKCSPVQKTDYIYVKARRGQATDSHSLAERVRRGRISERMKCLQSLVPGCNKVMGKTGMLDEIINYVQSLQRQVEFLSINLATAGPNFELSQLYANMGFPIASNIPATEKVILNQVKAEPFNGVEERSHILFDSVCENIIDPNYFHVMI